MVKRVRNKIGSTGQCFQVTMEPLLLVWQPRAIACIWHVHVENYKSAMVCEYTAAFTVQGRVAKWSAIGTEAQAVASKSGDAVESEPLAARTVVETPE